MVEKNVGKVVLILLLSINCATFRHNAIPVQEQLTELLEGVSRAADVGFSKEARQAFAIQVMIPAIDASLEVNDCLLNNNCKNLASSLTKLSGALLLGINGFSSLLPNGTLKDNLLNRLNSALLFVNNLRLKKDETEILEIRSPVYQAEIF